MACERPISSKILFFFAATGVVCVVLQKPAAAGFSPPPPSPCLLSFFRQCGSTPSFCSTQAGKDCLRSCTAFSAPGVCAQYACSCGNRPYVTKMERASSNPTLNATVQFSVTFSEAVYGVDENDFRVTGNLARARARIESVSAQCDRDLDCDRFRVIVFTGINGDGILGIEIIDNGTISTLKLDPQDEDERPFTLNGNGNNSSPTYIVDRSPPSTTNASARGKSGDISVTNTELEFVWLGFEENFASENPIVSYEVALSDDPDQSVPSADQILPADEAGRHTFLPSCDDAPCVFEEGEYRFWVRATNSLGLTSGWVTTVVEINSEAFKFGQDVLEYLSTQIGQTVTYADIDFENSSIPTDQAKIVRIPSAGLLLAGAVTDTAFPVTWAFNNGLEPITQLYVTSDEPARPPVVLYHTNDFAEGNEETFGDGPAVNLESVDEVTIHYNSRLPRRTNGISACPSLVNATQEYVCLEDSSIIRARGREGLILLEYTASNGDHLGVEIVQIKIDRFDSDGVVHIGSRLKPSIEPTDESGTTLSRRAIVRRGVNPEMPGNAPFIYQHKVPGAPVDIQDEVWAIRENTELIKMDVYWTKPGLEGIYWPYERRQYTSRWPEDAPEKYQVYVRDSGPDADTPGPSVTIPLELNPELACFPSCVDLESPLDTVDLDNGAFSADGPGWVLLKYATGPDQNPGQSWVGFEVVRVVDHTDARFDLSLVDKDIGTEILDDWQEPLDGGFRTGYIHAGTRYPPAIYDEGRGQIFAVNTDELEVWWWNLSETEDPEGSSYPEWPSTARVQWPSKVSKYRAVWPTAPEKIIIARQNGTGALDPALYPAFELYFQNDPAELGFNPNDEHAVQRPFKTGDAIFPLRDDLGSSATSLPHVLVQHRDLQDQSLWRFKLWKVMSEEGIYQFRDWTGVSRPDDPYEGVAGLPIQAPFPISTFPLADDPAQPCAGRMEGVSGPFFEDRKACYWVKAAGNDGGPATVVMRFYYPSQPGFFFPPGTAPADDKLVPWLDLRAGTPGIPIDVSLRVTWPPDCPSVTLPCAAPMKVGDTLTKAREGLPDVAGQCSADIIYQQSDPDVPLGGRFSRPTAILVDPVRVREVNLPKSDFEGSGVDLAKLSLALRARIAYDQDEQTLRFKGLLDNPYTREVVDDHLLNVMAERDRDELCSLDGGGRTCGSTAWDRAVEDLWELTSDPIEILDSSSGNFVSKALTTGNAQGTGYITLAMQDSSSDPPCGSALPVSLYIIKVEPELNTGSIVAIPAECAFDETLTLRHRGDFGGETGQYRFKWAFLPDNGGVPPTSTPESRPTDWTLVTTDEGDTGLIDYTIAGPGLLTLSDNWFIAQYRFDGSGPCPSDFPNCKEWSEWTDPQLAEGWIKRVLGNLNPFLQRERSWDEYDGSGGLIGGAERRFGQYGLDEKGVNTVVSMIEQAGRRYEGSVPLNCNDLNAFGLVEIYETVLNRGIVFSIDGLPPVDYPPANAALLLAAGRIADLYALLGNEAFADASDPTIGLGTDDGQYGAESSSIHAFRNVTTSLLDEELALLRGRDNRVAPSVRASPFYNRLIWNFTRDINGGEVAYALNYNIQDQSGNVDGRISESDARRLYPQGHGDAWGHYLSAIKMYYRLLSHRRYTWIPRAEAVLVAGEPVTVDYIDERKFASLAAAKARAGAEVVNLTYRSAYSEDSADQWQGYKDELDPERAWGLAEWGSRAGQGAYFDWVVGNAILPAVDPESCDLPGADADTCHTGIAKIDRTTVDELQEVAAQFQEIQSQIDTADIGLNPLGLAGDVVPFDIDPAGISSGKTHFEQIYDRAASAMNNAITVFDHANNSTQLLRRQADSLVNLQRTIEDREADFKNRLIESFGYPYKQDIGPPAGTYPEGYDGPDLVHHSYVDASELTGVDPVDLKVREYEIEIQDFSDVTPVMNKKVKFHIATGAGRFGEVKPPSWTERRAPGEIQLSRSDLLQARARFERALAEYDGILAGIEGQAAQLRAQEGMNAEEIKILNAQQQTTRTLQQQIATSRARQLSFRKKASLANVMGNAAAEALPLSAGFSVDVTSTIRSGIRFAHAAISESFGSSADEESLAELEHQNALQDVQAGTNLTLTSLRGGFSVAQALLQLEQTVRQENSLRLELFALQEAMQQTSGRYLSALARGVRIIDERSRFRRQTAGDIQARRYKDMAFRIFRNDALQKYRAQFDLAARYVYLAGKAYDFETALLSSDQRAGSNFLGRIVRERLIGNVQGGLPHTGEGLADPLARMSQNFEVLKGQLGFNNPQQETNRFSLRSEFLRILPGSAGNAAWREILRRHVVPNLLELPEFQQYGRIFEPHAAVEPAIVIPFSTTVSFGLNYFGWPLGGGDAAYDSTNFATKVRSVGVWFSNFDNLSLPFAPRVYLIPAGEDVLRTPTSGGVIRQFKILDQRLPVPFRSIGGNLGDPDWIPSVDSLTETFGQSRKFSSFRAYHDGGQFKEEETIRDSRLIGRSVWNTKWLLVIPAGTLSSDRNEGLSRFIDGRLVGGARDGNGVSDIKVFFQTYAYSGN